LLKNKNTPNAHHKIIGNKTQNGILSHEYKKTPNKKETSIDISNLLFMSAFYMEDFMLS
jgi:hypothetical protein